MANSLKELLIEDIKANGPMPLDQYMTHCLSHPEYGYYMGRDPLGRAGDFITAPEISQMFGEMLGAWLVDAWQRQGSPERFILLECGPGRGTLMADILRVAGKMPGFNAGVQVALLEVSPVLQDKQAQALDGFDVRWFEALDDVPDDAPLFVVANEFLDALPITQYQFSEGAWKERCVSVADGALVWALRPCDTPPDAESLGQPQEGDILERAPAQRDAFEALCLRIQKQGGAGLVIDYGYFEPDYGESLQAVKNNRFADVLAEPGKADLTAHVNFEMLAEAARKAGLECKLGTQGDFLQRCGIAYRAEALSKIADDKQRADIKAALHRLTSSGEMGTLFKVIEISKAENI